MLRVASNLQHYSNLQPPNMADQNNGQQHAHARPFYWDQPECDQPAVVGQGGVPDVLTLAFFDTLPAPTEPYRVHNAALRVCRDLLEETDRGGTGTIGVFFLLFITAGARGPCRYCDPCDVRHGLRGRPRQSRGLELKPFPTHLGVSTVFGV